MTIARVFRKAAGAVALTLACATATSAAPVVVANVESIGGGAYRYDLTIDNTDGTEPLSGMIVLFANSVFGLDDLSDISAPPAWAFLPPAPPSDGLFYFSLNPGGDVAVGSMLGGFSFRSDTAPVTLQPGEFAIDVIGAETFSQISVGDAHLVPEPRSGLLLLFGAAALVRRRSTRRRNRRALRS